VIGQCHALAALTLTKILYPLCRKLGGPWDWSYTHQFSNSGLSSMLVVTILTTPTQLPIIVVPGSVYSLMIFSNVSLPPMCLDTTERSLVSTYTSPSIQLHWIIHPLLNFPLHSWVKRDHLDVTCFIITLFSAQHVSDINTSETCWALNKVIIKQVTSSWSLFTQLSRWCTVQ